jgi:hypothetical protein
MPFDEELSFEVSIVSKGPIAGPASAKHRQLVASFALSSSDRENLVFP